MTWWDRPLYLHYLDRELGQSVGVQVGDATAEFALKCLLLGTTSPMYCGLSPLWESPSMRPPFRDLVATLLAAGLVDAVSQYPTLDEFLAARQRLYAHDSDRYPMYFSKLSAVDPIIPTMASVSSTTDTLAMEIAGLAASGQLGNALEADLARLLRAQVGVTLIGREGRAITFSLFAPALGQLLDSPIVVGFLRREMSVMYTRHYMQIAGGDLATGIEGLQYFDRLALEFPIFDVPLLRTCLLATPYAEVLRDPWTRHADFWTICTRWRQASPHVAFRNRLRLILRALFELVQVPVVVTLQEPAPIPVGSRNSIFAALQSAVASARPRITAGVPITDLSDAALLAINQVLAWLRRDRAFAAVLERVGSMTNEDRCDVLLVSATQIERDALLEAAGSKAGGSPLFGQRRTYFDLGCIGGARVTLLQCEAGSVGPGSSLVTVLDAIDELRPSCVLMVGIAFGTAPARQRIAQILVSKQLQCYEMQRVGTGATGEPAIIPRGDRVTASTKVLGRLRAATAGWTESVTFGLLLSGEKLVDNLALRTELVRNEPEAIGGEMEGAGLYTAAQERHVDWAVIKAICDWADGKKRVRKGDRQKRAADSAARFIVHALTLGGFAPDSATTIGSSA